MRVYTKLREMMLTNKDVLVRLEKIEKELLKQNSRTTKNEENTDLIFAALKKLLNPPQEPRQRIGFKP
ncbi:MAG: hypothetical protein WKF88_08100 [Ferruginibacter sp.]